MGVVGSSSNQKWSTSYFNWRTQYMHSHCVGNREGGFRWFVSAFICQYIEQTFVNLTDTHLIPWTPMNYRNYWLVRKWSSEIRPGNWWRCVILFQNDKKWIYIRWRIKMILKWRPRDHRQIINSILSTNDQSNRKKTKISTLLRNFSTIQIKNCLIRRSLVFLIRWRRAS